MAWWRKDRNEIRRLSWSLHKDDRWHTTTYAIKEDYAALASQEALVVFGQRSQLWWDLPLADSLRILQAMYRYGIMDLAIEEPTLEEVIRELYEHTDVLRTAPQEVP